jgi:3-deoxy-D-manno-octulosonic-acid transferase
MRLLYSLAIQFYYTAIFIASLFNKKAKLWVTGRKNLFQELQLKVQNRSRIIWVHCASLGEFEQGRPFMENIKKEHPDTTILLTFFSPSGFQVKKNDPVADIICYLPIDSLHNVIRFVKMVNPTMVVFVKYEYWYNYIWYLNQKKIPFYYISAIFREKQYFFKWYGGWFVNQLKQCAHFFVQDDKSLQLLHKLQINQVTRTGDTRFDRVYQIATKPYELEFVKQFKNNHQLMVAGSTWDPDEKIIKRFFDAHQKTFKLIIAPHEIGKNRIQSIKDLFIDYHVVTYTELENQDISGFQILILDTMGMLSKIYKYADYGYIGGAFGAGLHNILEAAVFGIPLFFGPKYQKFKEARDLVALEGAFSIQNEDELIQKITNMELLQDEYDKTCSICKTFVSRNIGAVDLICKHITKQLNS